MTTLSDPLDGRAPAGCPSRFPARSWMGRLAVGIALTVALTTAAYADKRVALVVGNSSYKNVPALPNPVNDAQDVAEKLTKLGFDVVTGIDVDLAGWRAALQQFERKAANADAAVFYFAGHGMQHQGQNYLMPVNAVLNDETSLIYDMISLNDVKNALDRTRISVRVIILDACRNNPLAENFQRSIAGPTRALTSTSRGLARIGKAEGMIVVYATAADQVAEDGKTTRNSPFTSAFLARLDEPGVEITKLFRLVRGDVISKTAQKQQPELHIALAQDFFLNTAETDAQAWDRVREGGDHAQIRDFIAKYPRSMHLRDAEFRVEMLDKEKRIVTLEKELEERRRLEAQLEGKPKAEGPGDDARTRELADKEKELAELRKLIGAGLKERNDRDRQRDVEQQRKRAELLAQIEQMRIDAETKASPTRETPVDKSTPATFTKKKNQ